MAALVVAFMALIVYLLSGAGAPVIRRDLSASWWTWPLQIATALTAFGAIVTLWQRKFRLARVLAASQVTLILWGWGNAQYPYLLVSDFTIYNSAAPPITLRFVLIALLAGVLLLFPSFYYLYHVFKAEPQSPDTHA
ncbi:MAG: cytochrome d ubiquinol oxidase subunit II [Acidobacteria bacterium]|nr:cytochrome d ubiquinol oxidase subunit II [Acidobacteriota bacterium]